MLIIIVTIFPDNKRLVRHKYLLKPIIQYNLLIIQIRVIEEYTFLGKNIIISNFKYNN